MKVKKRDIVYIGIVLCLLFLLKCSHDSKKSVQADLILKNTNIEAMQDSIKTTVLKNGQLVSQKKSMVSELKDLKVYNKSLYKKVNNLAKELKSKPVVYVNAGVKVIHDTVMVNSSVFKINDSTFKVPFSKDTIYTLGNERHLAGKLIIVTTDSAINVGKFTIDRDELIFNAEILLSEDGDDLIVSVTSKHPGFNAESITPVVLDPKLHPSLKKLNNKKFNVGPYFGIGIGTNFTIVPQIGIGLSYKIIQF